MLIFVASAGVFVFWHYKNQKSILAAIAQADKLMREDTYGGETPEKTFALFLDALRAGDTDLASKYFVLSKQEEWREDLRNVKKDRRVITLLEEFTRASETWRKGEGSNKIAFYHYGAWRDEHTITLPNGLQTTFPAGTYRQTVAFWRNDLVSKWKISQL